MCSTICIGPGNSNVNPPLFTTDALGVDIAAHNWDCAKAILPSEVETKDRRDEKEGQPERLADLQRALSEMENERKRREEETSAFWADIQRLLNEMKITRKRHEEEASAFLQRLQALEQTMQSLNHGIGRHREDLAQEFTRAQAGESDV